MKGWTKSLSSSQLETFIAQQIKYKIKYCPTKILGAEILEMQMNLRRLKNRIYANQLACSLWLSGQCLNFMSTHRGVNAFLA